MGMSPGLTRWVGMTMGLGRTTHTVSIADRVADNTN